MRSMVVSREEINCPAHDLQIVAVSLVRKLDGRWRVCVKVEGKVTIDENRHLDVGRAFNFRLNQTGAKPRGGNVKKKRKVKG